jgi:hypothetical protein
LIREHSPERRETLRHAGLSMNSELAPDQVKKADAIPKSLPVANWHHWILRGERSSSAPARDGENATERREEALYDAVFAAGQIKAAHGRAFQAEFGLDDAVVPDLVDRLRRHEGNARCGILARALKGYSINRVQQMVASAAERDSWRSAGLEPPSSSDPPSADPGVMGTPSEMTPSIAGVLHPEMASYRETGQCAAREHCAHPDDPIETGRRGDAKYHRECKQRAKRARRA